MDSGTKTWRNKLHKFRTQKRKLNGFLCRTGGCCFLLFQRIFKHQTAVFETRHPPFTKMCSRDFVIKNHIHFQSLPNCNDVYFNLCVLGLAKSIVHVNQSLIYYRTAQGNSITASRSKHPLCVYMAIRQTVKRLNQEEWWSFLRPHFNTQFIISIYYEFSCAPKEINKRMMNFWIKRGFKNVGMDACEENDFSEVKYYVKWKEINNQV